jgi:uncharacterized membrane protein YccC
VDPGLFSLKRAARAAIVMPCVFAFADKVINDPETAMFAAFGSFALLVLADFSGSRRARLAAYLSLAGAGAVLIVLGTLCSRSPWIAAAAMALVAFAILYSAVINGYFAAGGTAAMLTFLLPVNLPASPAVIPARLEGWALAASVGICAVMFLWPEPSEDKLRAAIARACHALAELLECDLAGAPALFAQQAGAARAAVAEPRQEFLGAPYRPTGPTRTAEAIAFLVDELEWFQSFALVPGEPGHRPDLCRDENGEVLSAVIAVLRESAARLGGRDGDPDLDRLDRAREAVAEVLTRRIAELPSVSGELELAAALEPSFRMRALSYSARQIATNALQATGGAAVPDIEEAQERRWYRPADLQTSALEATSALQATEQLAVEQASPHSALFRNSVRGAAAVAISVFIAQEAGLQHAFWVALGTLSVLRSNALSTGATVLSGLAGTAVGIVVGAGLIYAIGSDEAVTWAVLPPAVLLAAYAPRVISFAAGQAAFTLVVLMLFNLIQPSGWQVGIVRVEDIAIGFAVSIVVGLLFWPRGGATFIRRSLGIAYARAADFLVAAGGLVTGGDPVEPEQAAQAARVATRRLDDAFRQHLGERSTEGRMDMERIAALVAGARRVERTARALLALSPMTDGFTFGERCARSLDRELEELHRWYTSLGDALADGGGAPAQHEPDTRRLRRVLQCAHQAVTADDEAQIAPALSLLWASQYLDNLWRLEAHLGEPRRPPAATAVF